MSSDEALQHADQVRVTPKGKIGFDASLERDEPELVQSHDRGLSERLVRDVSESGAAPERKRLAQPLCGDIGRGTIRLVDEAREAIEIEFLMLDPQQVARGAGFESLRRTAERLPELRNSDL